MVANAVNRWICLVFVLACMGCAARPVGRSGSPGEFFAYYTRIDSGEPFEKHARVGDHADIVVRLKHLDGKLVFWRGSSYLPYWETSNGRWYVDEIIPRTGDGTEKMPDRVNTYSRVSIIDTSPEQIMIHWRYLPEFGGTNPHTGVDATKFVDEYFGISPEGYMIRFVAQGTEKYDDWIDPLNGQLWVLRLTATGITSEKATVKKASDRADPLKGSPVKPAVAGTPVRWWHFDEGAGDVTVEETGKDRCTIAGHKSYWKKGISGTALQFDGYNTVVSLPAEKAPAITTGLTLEGWIAIGAYPWNWAPVVQQGDDDGYFLGVDGHGHAGFKVTVGGRWEELVSEKQLDRNRWYHLAGTFAQSDGTMRLFIDGRQCGTKTVAAGVVQTTGDPIQIGKGKDRAPIDPVRRNTFSDSYSFDGLIDEVKIYDVALTPNQIERSFKSLQPPASLRDDPDMDARVLPAGAGTGTFGGSYTHLKFYEVWDGLWRFGPYPDVVVEFDALPCSFVFWRGTCYIPMMVNEKGQWYSNEFNETWGTSGGRGCQEPMSDKEAYTNHARIIENTRARVVVQWRYPLVDVFHVTGNYNEETGWGDWSDWYYYIYPDGVAVKRMRLWTHGNRNHEWHEAMAIFGPDQHPEQIIEKENTLTLADLEGDSRSYNWIEGPPRISGREYRQRQIHLVNYTAAYDPFTIAEFIGGNVYGGELRPYAVFPTWNHWPVAQMPSDGRYASFPDRTAHSSLTHAPPSVYREDFGDRPYQERLMMEGMTNKSAAELAPLARSWMRAPEGQAISGCRSTGYDMSQRAYVLIAEAPALSFSINASEDRPLVNLCLVVKNWGAMGIADVTVDGKKVQSRTVCRQGVVRDPHGEPTLVVWLERTSRAPVTVTLTGAAPKAVAGPTPDPLSWEQAPAVHGNGLAITMKAREASNVHGVEYLFDCVDHETLTSGWTSSREYSLSGLSPNTRYTFRVKAREPYLLAESGWSQSTAATTGDAPGPRAHWTLDDGSGTAVADTTGAHDGTVKGTPQWSAGRDGTALTFDGTTAVLIGNPAALTSCNDFTWTAWIKTEHGGTIVGRTGAGRTWTRGGKVLFIGRDGLTLDVGWVGAVHANAEVNDGAWHFVAVAVDISKSGDTVAFYVDGKPAGRSSRLNVDTPEPNLPVKIGYCNEDFPRPQSGFRGQIDDVRWYDYVLNTSMVRELYERYSK